MHAHFPLAPRSRRDMVITSATQEGALSLAHAEAHYPAADEWRVLVQATPVSGQCIAIGPDGTVIRWQVKGVVRRIA